MTPCNILEAPPFNARSLPEDAHAQRFRTAWVLVVPWLDSVSRASLSHTCKSLRQACLTHGARLTVTCELAHDELLRLLAKASSVTLTHRCRCGKPSCGIRLGSTLDKISSCNIVGLCLEDHMLPALIPLWVRHLTLLSQLTLIRCCMFNSLAAMDLDQDKAVDVPGGLHTLKLISCWWQQMPDASPSCRALLGQLTSLQLSIPGRPSTIQHPLPNWDNDGSMEDPGTPSLDSPEGPQEVFLTDKVDPQVLFHLTPRVQALSLSGSEAGYGRGSSPDAATWLKTAGDHLPQLTCLDLSGLNMELFSDHIEALLKHCTRLRDLTVASVYLDRPLGDHPCTWRSLTFKPTSYETLTLYPQTLAHLPSTLRGSGVKLTVRQSKQQVWLMLPPRGSGSYSLMRAACEMVRACGGLHWDVVELRLVPEVRFSCHARMVEACLPLVGWYLSDSGGVCRTADMSFNSHISDSSSSNVITQESLVLPPPYMLGTGGEEGRLSMTGEGTALWSGEGVTSLSVEGVTLDRDLVTALARNMGWKLRSLKLRDCALEDDVWQHLFPTLPSLTTLTVVDNSCEPSDSMKHGMIQMCRSIPVLAPQGMTARTGAGGQSSSGDGLEYLLPNKTVKPAEKLMPAVVQPSPKTLDPLQITIWFRHENPDLKPWQQEINENLPKGRDVRLTLVARQRRPPVQVRTNAPAGTVVPAVGTEEPVGPVEVRAGTLQSDPVLGRQSDPALGCRCVVS